MRIGDLSKGTIGATRNGATFRVVAQGEALVEYELVRQNKAGEWESWGQERRQIGVDYEPERVLLVPGKEAPVRKPEPVSLSLRELARAAKVRFRTSGKPKGLLREMSLAVLEAGGSTTELLAAMQEYLSEPEGQGRTKEQLAHLLATEVSKCKRQGWTIEGSWGSGFVKINRKG